MTERHTPSKHVGADRTVIVHRVHDESSTVPPVDQLMAHARTTIPAILNYLYFGAADMAVLYFGKSRDGSSAKKGIVGAEEMKLRMLKFLTLEIWPQLLRTDVPDDSQTGDAFHASTKPCATSGEENDSPVTEGFPSMFPTSPLDFAAKQRQEWLRKSLDSGMQVLIYLKRGVNKTKYLKLILSNPLHRIHFDVADHRDEKYRWDNRMLFVRMLDNLETQKAIDSYETYERYFREACECASKHSAELERPDQPLVPVVYHRSSFVLAETSLLPSALLTASASDSAAVLGTSPRLDLTTPQSSSGATHVTAKPRSYAWFENLNKPESLTLDYKSYFSQPALEIQYRAVKFMCGFLNGIGEGKLVVGVHEMDRMVPPSAATLLESAPPPPPRTSPAGARPSRDTDASDNEEGRGAATVSHNSLVDQIVVGVSVSDADLLALQLELSEQLQQCIPPIPPQAVQLDIVPVVFPVDAVSPGFLMLLYDTAATGWKDAMRTKSNHAIRRLRRRGYSLCALPVSTRAQLHDEYPSADAVLPAGVTGWQLYAIVPIVLPPASPPSLTSPQQVGNPSSSSALLKDFRDMLDVTKSKGQHVILQVPRLPLPTLRVIEVSVDIARCGPPLSMYRGKFFCGWPSIPIWNPITESIARVDRNYHIFSQDGSQQRPSRNGAASHDGVRSSWAHSPTIVAAIMSFVCGSQFSRSIKGHRLRLLGRSFNAAFEQQLGLPLVEILQSTPVGTPGFTIARETMSLLQTSLKVSRLSQLPLLLVHMYERLGALLSPFPYVATPVSFQSLRVNPTLIPLYMVHEYETMMLRPDVVLDVADGYLKKVVWCGSAAHVETILGIGFAKVSKKSLEAWGRFAHPTHRRLERTRSLRTIKINKDHHEHLVRATRDDMGLPSQSSTSAGTGSNMGSPGRSFDPCEMLSIRRFEPRVPLMHFAFLYGESGKIFHSSPWTLSHLLKWLHAASHDPHVRSFGYCDRSFGFYPDLSREVCTSHIGGGDDDDNFSDEASPRVADGGSGPHTPASVYASSFDCTVCRLMMEWNSAAS